MRTLPALFFSLTIIASTSAQPAGKETTKALTTLAKKAFGEDFQSIAASEPQEGKDNFEITCLVQEDEVDAEDIQKKAKAFAASYFTSGRKASHIAIAYETRMTDDLGNERLTAIANMRVQMGLAPLANWKAPEKIKFHSIFATGFCHDRFKPAWDRFGN